MSDKATPSPLWWCPYCPPEALTPGWLSAAQRDDHVREKHPLRAAVTGSGLPAREEDPDARR
jgi:hypothetical protein